MVIETRNSVEECPRDRTGVEVEKLQREEAILDFEVKRSFADGTATENIADGTAQKQQQTW